MNVLGVLPWLIPPPTWLSALAWVSVIVAALAVTVITVDILAGRRQMMRVMDVVWPITGLYWGPGALWAYFSFGRAQPRSSMTTASMQQKAPTPMWKSVFIGTCHCGAGCSLGDIVGEVLVHSSGLVLLGSMAFTFTLVPFLFAFLFGVGFQYATIAPMSGQSGWPVIRRAIKADAVSITAYEIGMLTWMLFSRDELLGSGFSPWNPVYILTMQVAMVVGFWFAYPANWWLIRKGVKTAM